MNWKPTGFISFALCAVLAACCLLCCGVARAQDEELNARDVERVITANRDELKSQETDVRESWKVLKSRLEEIDKTLSSCQNQYYSIIFNRQVSRTNPFQTRTEWRSLAYLEAKVDNLSGSVDTALRDSKRMAESVEDLDQELKSLTKEGVPSRLRDDVAGYLGRLKVLRSLLERMDKTGTRTKESVASLRDKIGISRSEAEKRLSAQWKEFFLDESDFLTSPTNWSALPGQFIGWVSRSWDMVAVDVVRTVHDWKSALFYLLAIWACVFTPGLFLLKASLRFFDEKKVLRTRHLLHSWGFFSLGLALSLAGARDPSGNIGIVTSLSNALMGWGAISIALLYHRGMHDRVRYMAVPSLFLAFLAGITLLILDAPANILFLLWGVVLAVFHWVLKYRIKSVFYDREEKVFHYSRGLWVVAAVLLLIGYPRLSVLFVVCWMIIRAMALLGRTLVEVFQFIAERKIAGTLHEIGESFIIGIISPLVWFGVVAGTVYWVVLHLGGVFILERMTSMEISWKGVTVQMVSIFAVFFLFYVFRSGVVLVRTSIEHAGKHWPRSRKAAVPSLQSIATYFLWAVYILLGLNILGVSLTSLWVVAGGLSVGIGFGLQNIVNNFLSGLIILFERSIQHGDVIQLDDIWCTVKKINMRTTVVETFDHAAIIVPNADLISNRMTNWTKNDSIVRRDIVVGVAYGSDTDLVRETLLKLARSHKNVLKQPAPSVLFHEFGASSLDFILRIWVDDLDNMLTATSELRYAIDRAFREQKIEIAFPQLDVHVRDGELGIRTSDRVRPVMDDPGD